MSIETINPEIQEKILDILPDDGPLALNLIAQLTANMILSIKDANITDYFKDLRKYLDMYQGT